jgi:hypothetical protein
VLISEWRGQRKVEVRDYTAVIADVYFAAGAGVTLDIEHLPKLIELLTEAQKKAASRCDPPAARKKENRKQQQDLESRSPSTRTASPKQQRRQPARQTR